MTPAPERPCSVYGCHSPGHVFTDRRAAAPVTDAGLDVERLARAIQATRPSGDYQTITVSRQQAERIAAEYAARSRQAEKETA